MAAMKINRVLILKVLRTLLAYIKSYVTVNFIHYAYETDQQMAQKQALI